MKLLVFSDIHGDYRALERLMEVERGLIIEALSKTGGVQSRATELLGINQRSLWHRIKKLHIDVKSFKNPEN